MRAAPAKSPTVPHGFNGGDPDTDQAPASGRHHTLPIYDSPHRLTTLASDTDILASAFHHLITVAVILSLLICVFVCAQLPPPRRARRLNQKRHPDAADASVINAANEVGLANKQLVMLLVLYLMTGLHRSCPDTARDGFSTSLIRVAKTVDYIVSTIEAKNVRDDSL